MKRILLILSAAAIVAACGPSKSVVMQQQRALADEHFAAGRYAEAAEIYTQLIAKGQVPDSALNHHIALSGYHTRNYDVAVQYGTQYFASYPTAEVARMLEDVYLQTSRPAQALALMDHAAAPALYGSDYASHKALLCLDYAPERLATFYDSIDVADVRSKCFDKYFARVGKSKAEAELKAICKSALNDNPMQRAALEYLSVGTFTQAEARYKAAMAEYEKKKNATTYAYLRRDLKRISADYREAQAGFEKLRTIDPDNKNYIKYLITIYSRLDRDDKAKQLKKLL